MAISSFWEVLWHTKTTAEALTELRSRETGLRDAEAAERLKEYGPNVFPEPVAQGLFAIFFSQFLSPLIYILLIAGAIVLFLGEVADGIIIFGVLFFNAVVGAIQEGKAQNTLAALRTFVSTNATVLRDGRAVIVPDKEVVPGDIVILHEGEKVPADARVIEVHSLNVNESSFTGEPFEVSKRIDPIAKRASSIHEQTNMVFKGTTVVSGYGKGMVTATGLQTEIGKISKEVARIDTDMPLRANIRRLSYLIIAAVGVIGLMITLVGILRGLPLSLLIATAASLGVSIIPEGLPIVLTLVLAVGVMEMTKKNVLVKKLQAVEALGQAKIIAVDKTGTLTKNEMVVRRVYADGRMYDVLGDGYEARGALLLKGELVEPLNHPEIVLLAKIAALATNAEVMRVEKTQTWKVSGDPTEAALKVFAEKVGFLGNAAEDVRIIDEPFDYSTKYHLTVHTISGSRVLTVIGAPERILELAKTAWHGGRARELQEEERKELEKHFLELSDAGLRVVAGAFLDPASEYVAQGKLPPLVFAGFFGLKDPLRDGVPETIRRAREAGIRVIMITGDHAVTARAIAKEAGLVHERAEIITGEDMEKLSRAELRLRFQTCNVFARVTPEHKLQIIEIFRERGEVVAMTGDGVNDAPSLAAADLGVSMGKVGTEVAKEASDLVLLDDDFGNIIAAVEEGRSIYKTIKKVLLYLFSTSIGELLTIMGALVAALPLPLFPVQIIWLNFVTDGFLVVALAFEPKEKGLLARPMRRPNRFIMDLRMAERMLFMGLVIGGASLLTFVAYLDEGFPKAVTVTLTVLAALQWFNAWNVKHESRSVFAMNPMHNPALVGATAAVVILQLLAVYHPLFQEILHTVPLGGTDWVYIVAISSSVLFLEEIRKLLTHRMHRESSIF